MLLFIVSRVKTRQRLNTKPYNIKVTSLFEYAILTEVYSDVKQ